MVVAETSVNKMTLAVLLLLFNSVAWVLVDGMIIVSAWLAQCWLAGCLFGGYMVGVLCSSSVVALILDCHRRRSSSLQIPNNKWVVVPPSYHKCMYKQSKRRLNRQMYACFQRIHHHHSRRRRRDRNGNKVHFMTAITTSISIISTKNNIISSNSNNSDIDGSGIKKWSMGWFVGRTDEQLDWSSSGGGYDDDGVSSLSK